MNIIQKYTLDTYMPGYILACVHIYKDTNIYLYVYYTGIWIDSTHAYKHTTDTDIETH